MFSQKKITGSRQTAARLSASWNAPWAAAPSPKKATATLSSPRSCGRHGGTVGDRKAGRHDAVGPEDPEPGVGDVHRAAAAPVGSLVPGHQLGEHAHGIQALGQAVAVAAVGGGDDVVGAQRPARADGRRLLADGEVDEAGDQAVAVELGDPLLEAADQHHAALHLQQVGRGSTERLADAVTIVYCTDRYKREADVRRRSRSPTSFPTAGEVAGKRVVITGAGRGLGHAARPRLLRGRRAVALVARTERDLKAVAETLPGPSLVLSGDVTDEDFNEAVADAAVARVGWPRRLDLQRRHLAGRGRPARDRAWASGGRSST